MACERSAFASVSNQSAISSKPSSRAVLAIPGYISVYSWVSPATAALRLSEVVPIGRPSLAPTRLSSTIRSIDDSEAEEIPGYIDTLSIPTRGEKVERGELVAADIDEEMLGSYLSLSEISEPDLLIRTGGDHRVSNFLLWDLAYTEMYFSDLFWPDFDAEQLMLALQEYASRQRRFGRR